MPIALSPYDDAWPGAFADLARVLEAAIEERAIAIDHIGSTAIPGLVAKPVIDAQVIVASLDERDALTGLFGDAGFDPRPGDWNLRDHVPPGWSGDAGGWSKFVLGPRELTEPLCNIHVRASGSPNERYALLFRDFLRDDPMAREAWGAFKVRLAASVATLPEYGQVKDPATDVLMTAAERWATSTGWVTRGSGKR